MYECVRLALGNTILDDRLDTALELMLRALEIIDEADVRSDVGAHLDLAIARLIELQGVGADNALHSIDPKGSPALN